MTNDPYIRDMIAAHRAGVSVYAIAKAVGMGWRTVSKIVNTSRSGCQTNGT